jgi:DNA-binding CsgD family transcriptional regulator
MSADDDPIPKPQFSHFLASFPHPITVPRALVRGPLSNFAAGGGFLAFPTDGDCLRTMGAYGYTEEEMDRYALVPLSLSSALTDAFKLSETIVMTFDQMLAKYRHTEVDQDLWEGMRVRFGHGDVVSAPVVAQGTTLGVLGFNTTEHRRWTSQEIAYVEGTCAVLGIWATHPLSGVQTPQVWRPVGEATLALSDRQKVILRLVELGKSNASIALALGYSSSTVKAEIQKALRSLKVNDRVAAAKRAHELGLLEDAVKDAV